MYWEGYTLVKYIHISVCHVAIFAQCYRNYKIDLENNRNLRS